MAHRILVTLDLSKVDKKKVIKRTYTNRAGEEVTANEYKIEIVPLKEAKSIKTGKDWELFKTHFVIEALTDDEKEEEKKATSLGDGLIFKDTSGKEEEEEDWFG